MTSHAPVERLCRAVNDHNLDALADCFSPDFRNETPAHPGRGFSGRAQVRANWARIFAGIPNIAATVLRTAVQGDSVWTEWEMAGTRSDGVPQALRGVIIFGEEAEQLSWCRFYLEPVDAGDDGIETTIGRIAEASR